jgi:type IV secretion system protein VirB10
MNQPMPPDSGDGHATQPGNAPGGAQSPSNAYSAHYEQMGRQQPNLDSGAPVLRAMDGPRTSRRALGLLLALVLVLAVVAIWALNSFMSRNNKPQKPREETVSVPEAPKPPPLQQQLPPQQPPKVAQAIPVAPLPPKPPRAAAVNAPRGLTLLERRILDSNAAAATGVNGAAANNPLALWQAIQGTPKEGAQEGASDDAASAAAAAQQPGYSGPPQYAMPGNPAYKAPALEKTASALPLIHPDMVLTRGTYIRCVMETHIVTDVPGFTSCMVTEPVYSFTGKRLLLPKGSKVLGKYGQTPVGNRVAVVWDRILTPTGIDVNMASPGVDTLGGAGMPGYLDRHWAERIGAALLVSILSDAFSYEAAKHSPAEQATITNGAVVVSPWQSNTAQTLQDFSQMAVREAANRPSTVTIHQGTIIYVYVAKDVDFSGVVARM